MSRIRVPGIVRLLYNHNPFYLLSAVLFLYGLRMLFRPGRVDFIFERFEVVYIDPWWLMISLCGVTLLMAVTAFLIVRFGKVWEDARSLVLVLLLMFLAISVSFDEIVTLASWEDESLREPIGLFGFGFAFSLFVSEALIRGLKIGLPWGYRAPMYGLIGLFFAFPMWVSPEVSDISIEQARWRVMTFPALAGVLTLFLIPAVQRGSASLQNNGTPWKWPWFPWAVFVFLAGAVCLRSYSLAISFDVGKGRAHFWDTSFGLYFLIPFLLACLFVLLEVGLADRLKRLQSIALWSAAALPVVAYPSLGPLSRFYTYSRFVDEFVTTLASPVYLALMGLVLFYGYAWLRGLRRAEWGFVAAMFALVFTGSDDLRPDFSQPHVWPLAVLGVLEMTLGIMRSRSRELLVGASIISLAAGLQLDATQFTAFQATVAYHLLLGSVLVIAAFFHDRLALFLRRLGAVALAITGLAALFSGNRYGVTVDMLAAYVGGLTVVAFVWSIVFRERLFVIAALVNLAGCVGALLWSSWQRLEIPDAVKPLLWAGTCFAVAVLISVLKGGLADRIQSRWQAQDPLPDIGET